MKLVNKNINKAFIGSVTLVPEESEDLWHAFNLIREHDTLRCTAIRKVSTESATGSVSTNKVRTTLTVQVEAIDFDTEACILRVRGQNVSENQYVKMGAYHTLDLEVNRKFTLFKEFWDTIALGRIDEACDPTKTADLAAVVMQPGIAHICLITNSMTLVKARIRTNIPRKRRGQCDQHTKGLNLFYDQIIQAILRSINFDVVKCVLVASPGFLKEQFLQYLFDQAIKQELKVLTQNKGKFIQVHSSSGFKHSLKEILADPVVLEKLSDTKASREVKALDVFYQMLRNDSDKAIYGVKHCEKAAELQAVETLLVSDTLFRAQNVQMRKCYVALVDSVKDSGGDVKIFSSLHVSGEQLDLLSGVAAILRFHVEDEDYDSE